MKTLAHVLAGALIAGAAFAASAGDAVGIYPAEAIPDNLPRLASPGPYDDFIKEVQQKLNELGFDAGPVNGDLGEKTQAALAQFQLSRVLPASGALDDGTLYALGIERPAEARSAAVGSAAPAEGATAAD